MLVENGVSLVGGETAEMPDVYLEGEHDLVGIVTGIVEKDKIIDGSKITPGDVVLGLPSNGLHTNGYSLARKILFEVGGYKVDDKISELDKSVGQTLLEPHINYTTHIFSIIESLTPIKGIAHITGGGLIENIPRILPMNTSVLIDKESWPTLPIFNVMQNIGKVDSKEMFRAFNMGIGMILVVDKLNCDKIKSILEPTSLVYKVGKVVSGKKEVIIQ